MDKGNGGRKELLKIVLIFRRSLAAQHQKESQPADTRLSAGERSNHTTGQLIHVDGGYMHLDRAV